jgi:periplasmic divalent cation tolerance protein
MNESIVLLVTTFASELEASDVAGQLLQERLVACAQIEGRIRSVYRWKGEVQDEEEVRVTLKLPREVLDRCRERIEFLHPYEVPEIVVLEASAADAYARWVRESCC